MNETIPSARHIDPQIAEVSGEASAQRVWETRGSLPVGPSVGPEGAIAAAREPDTYYGMPAIKEPVWEWAIPVYFWAGGAAGAALTFGAVAQLLDRRALRVLISRCRVVGLLGTSVGTALLICDLGRPLRFLNMLRVFRPTSPMNVGAWILAGTASAAGVAVVGEVGALSAIADAAGLAAGAGGGPLAGYTGVLLASTAVPIWQATRRALPPFFLSSALASAAALLELLPAGARERRVIRRIAIIGKAGEIAGAVAVERAAARVERVARPLASGLSGALWTAGKLLSMSSLALTGLARSRRQRAVAGVLGTAGALAFRFALLYAGKASARDPRATFEPQRAGYGAAEIINPRPRRLAGSQTVPAAR